MKENIKLAKQHFSDWEVRIYHNNTVPEKYINEYKELDAICILCENIGINKLNWEGMFWRWLPLDDPDVDIWLSRDADSRLSQREAKIVDEWINSGKTLHCIRDHRCHFNYIMGGLFGINNKLFHEKYKFKTVKEIIKELSVYYKERPYNVDQIFLNDNLWKILKDDVMAHISNDGRRVFSTDILIPSVPDFIGKQYRLNNDLIIEKANIKSVNPAMNLIFKIKSKYKELYLDALDDKIKLNILTQEPSQLWKLDENNRLINLLNNKFIDTDNNHNLILTDNEKNKWQFQQGGFIINQQNNMAIDIKGGINDKRKEVWLFKINYSEAQQWDFVADIFKIKAKYKELYLDAIDDKIKLNIFTQEQSQLWKLDKNNRLINLLNNKFLDTDTNHNLILTDNEKNKWEFQQGGFIINQQNNMAIDIKGGINDKRKEVWLFKINNSEAQQWDFVDQDNNESKTKKLVNYSNIYTITTSIPSEVFISDIDEVIKNKKVDIYDGIKNRAVGCNYEFKNEQEYYNAYKEAKWGFTKKKNGWDCLRHYEIIANGCLPLFENLENCPENTLNNFPKQILIEAKNKKVTMSDSKYNYYLKTIFNYFKDNFTCEKVAENFLTQIHKNSNKKLSNVKIIFLHGNQCNNYMADMLFIGLRRLLNENIVDEKKLVQLYKSFTGQAYGKGFTYTKRLDDQLVIDRDNIKEKIANKFFDYIIYRKCGGDEGELGDCRKNMEYWNIVEKNYNINQIIFLYGGDRMTDMKINNNISEHLKYHSNKGLCFVRELNTECKVISSKKNILVLNEKYHHKNKKGFEMICEYLNYNVIYGSEKDIPYADVIYCPIKPFNVSKYPNKRFVFGPHLSIFPDNKLPGLQNQNNCVYIQPSPYARDVWTNWKDMDAEKFIPIKSFPFPVEVDLFKPDEHEIKENIFVMFKHRKPEELKFVENFLNNKKISYKTFRYGSYKQDDYVKHLKTCKYGIWIGRHESQGFALQESLSCNVPLLVWNVTNMRQQHGWNGCPDVYGITIPYWSKTCGEYFYKEDEFEKKYNIFLQNLNNYKPREFILNTVSVKQCADNFEKVFLNKKTNNKEYKLLTCANQNYFNALKQFINNVKEVNIDFDNFIVYDIGLTSDQENELYILQAEYRFYIYKLDFSKYPEHVNLNLEKWNGLNNSYAFKAIVIYNVLHKIDVPLIYMDCGCGFTMETIDKTLINISKNHFYIPIANNKNSIESIELNHHDTLKHFDIKNTEIITASANFMGIDYNNDATKKIINEWYNYALKQEIICPIGSNRNNHRQDQTVLSCILHNNKYNYYSNINVPLLPWKNRGSNTYYNKYKPFSCFEKITNKYEARIYTNSLEEAIQCYQNRKNILREQLLKDFIIK
jgi:hypothetical protein